MLGVEDEGAEGLEGLEEVGLVPSSTPLGMKLEMRSGRRQITERMAPTSIFSMHEMPSSLSQVAAARCFIDVVAIMSHVLRLLLLLN